MTGGLRIKGRRKGSAPGSPLISIITVVFNGVKSLEQAIASVLGQDYPNIEYIIVDGGSTDGTLDIIRKYDERIDYWVSERDKGIYDAMNKGIDLAGGDSIGLLNADDYYEPGAVKLVADAWVKGGAESIIYGGNYVSIEDLGIRFEASLRMRFWKGMPICHQAMFVPREVYRSVGKYDLAYRITADLDFLLRAVRRGVPLLPLNRPVVTFRATGMSTMNSAGLLRENGIILKRHFGMLSATFAAFVGFSVWTKFMLWLRRMVQTSMGDEFLLKARHCYTRLFIAKGKAGR